MPLPVADQSRAPLADLLRREIGAHARWTVPAHLGGTTVCDDALDLLGSRIHEADLWPSQRAFAAALADAEELAAQVYGAGHSWLLTTGATGGNHAWVAATVGAHESVVVDAACHTSVLAAIGRRHRAHPHWVARDLHPDLGLPMPLDPAAVETALRTAPVGVRQVVVTSPTYSGVVSDLPAIAEVCRRFGVELFVDQAWAPHLALADDAADVDGLRAGAAGAVVSQHKTGAALSGAAVLLAGRGTSPDRADRLARAVGELRSTSPLLPVLVSSDLARRALALGGTAGVRQATELARRLAEQLGAVPGVRVLGAADLAVPGAPRPPRVDPLKLVVDVTGLGRTGWDVAEALHDVGIHVEGADTERLYLVCPATVTPHAARRAEQTHTALVDALTGHHPAGDHPTGGVLAGPVPGPDLLRTRIADSVWAKARGAQLLTPSEALEARRHRVPLPAAVGQVAAECVSPYPPGVPVVVPGAVVTPEAVEILEQVRDSGGEVHGTADPSGRTVAVVVA